MLEITSLFSQSPNDAWHMYLELPDWKSREEVVEELKKSVDDYGYSFFTEQYRHKMKPYIRDDFYENVLFNEDAMQELIHKYHCEGNIDVPFLKDSSLGM